MLAEVESGNMLSVRDLSVSVSQGGARVVDGLSFDLAAGSMIALVGESGSGKTMAARAVLNLLPPPLVIEPQSSILFDGTDLTQLDAKGLRAIRGASIGMVFQEPMVSLNPSMTIGEQMAEGLRLHRKMDRKDIREQSIAMLERIRINDPHRCLLFTERLKKFGLHQLIAQRGENPGLKLKAADPGAVPADAFVPCRRTSELVAIDDGVAAAAFGALNQPREEVAGPLGRGQAVAVVFDVTSTSADASIEKAVAAGKPATTSAP
nr:ATP-binding cassette domain-containing protein [Mesorhizobium xinjiangense]